MNPEEIVPEGVSVESGIRLIGAEAWQNCRQFRIVKLPATVVGISDNVFHNCKLLNSVSALVAGNLDAKSLRNAAPHNGCMHRKGLQIGSAAKPSSGITSLKDAST